MADNLASIDGLPAATLQSEGPNSNAPKSARDIVRIVRGALRRQEPQVEDISTPEGPKPPEDLKTYFQEAYDTVVASFKERGIDLTDENIGEQIAGNYRVRPLDKGLVAIREFDTEEGPRVETLTLTPKARDVFIRQISVPESVMPSGEAGLRPTITAYVFDGERISLRPGTSDVISMVDLKTFKSEGKGLDGEALDNFVKNMQQVNEIRRAA